MSSFEITHFQCEKYHFRYCVRMALFFMMLVMDRILTREFAMPMLNTLPGFEQLDPNKQAMMNTRLPF